MASGFTLSKFTALHNEPPTSNYATLDVRNAHPVLDFDAATDEAAVFTDTLANYAGNGLTCILRWAATSATSGDVIWNAALERIDAGTLDIDADSFASANAATTTCSGTSGVTVLTTITFTSGAQMDSMVNGDAFRLKITRNASGGGDTMAGDAELLTVEIKET